MTVAMLERDAASAFIGSAGYIYEPDRIRGRSIEDEFEQLADEWLRETQYLSSVTEIVGHEDYLRIISMGERVVPLILRRLKDEPNHWFRALEIITRANPVSPDDSGDLDAMASAWIGWGRVHGLIE